MTIIYIRLFPGFLVTSFFICFFACHTQTRSNGMETADSTAIVQDSISGDSTRGIAPKPSVFLPYDLDHPDGTLKLPVILNEISGLSITADNRIFAVQDELGRIYEISTASGEIVEEYFFDDNGDFEGIEVVGTDAYAVESNGVITWVENFLSKSPQVKKIKTPLSEKNDIEGLTYLSKGDKLLLACKGEAGIGQSMPRQRTIYSFDRTTLSLDKAPFLTINLEEIRKFLLNRAKKESEKEFAQDFDPEDRNVFQPSGIAFHPKTGDLYIIASSGRLLLVLDGLYRPIGFARLDKDLFKQPEGIAFDTKGTLYISNEAKDGRANILIFRQQ